jgi:hypothetical protein
MLNLMTIDQMILSVIGGGVGIISYYLKQNLKDLKENQVKTTSVENRLSLIEQQSREEIKHLSEITNSKLEVVQNDISHMNGNLKQYMGNVNKLFEISQQNTLNIDRMVKVIDKHDDKFAKYDNNILEFFQKYQLVEK